MLTNSTLPTVGIFRAKQTIRIFWRRINSGKDDHRLPTMANRDYHLRNRSAHRLDRYPHEIA